MASCSTISITPEVQPVFGVSNLDTESASAASIVLQENHDKHHILSSAGGFHILTKLKNHTVHHVLSLYALGASAATIKWQYEDHKKIQRSFETYDPALLDSMSDPKTFREFLAKQERYPEFLEFFKRQILSRGTEKTVKDFMLAGNEQADDLLARCYAGFLHPLIHLGFALEFQQPALVAEALAQAALHRDYLLPFFSGAERLANEMRGVHAYKASSLQNLLSEIRDSPTLATAAHWDDDNKIRDGILVRAPQEMTEIGSKWIVAPDELAFRNAEMVNAVACYTLGAQSPPKQVKMDFYFMHCVNCSIFFSSILENPGLSQTDKIRLLEWKGRNDLVMYASRRAPAILEEEWKTYQAKAPGSWDSLFTRVNRMEEDGHACKMLRALAHGEQVCRPFESRPEIRIKQADWLILGHMLLDSVEDVGNRWVRSAGFSQAWDQFKDRYDSNQ